MKKIISAFDGLRFSEVIAENGGVSDSLIQELNTKVEEIRDQSAEKFKAACLKAKVKYPFTGTGTLPFRNYYMKASTVLV